jgi:multicomponent Na+:H+ antiporter subunit D
MSLPLGLLSGVDPAHWTTLAVMGPLLAALVALRGSPWALRIGLVLGSLASLVASVGMVAALVEMGILGGGETAAGAAIRNPLGGWGAPLGIELRADGLAVVMVALTAFTGSLVSLYASAYFGDLSALPDEDAPAGRGARFFAPLWLLLWSSLNGIYLSADLFNLYVMLEVLGIGAAALVTLAVTSKATVAGMRYLLVSLAGSLLFLLGVALLYVEVGVLALPALAEARPSGPLPALALALITVGMAAKTALFPLHAWLPPAHAAAPAPGSAVLSALVVKGSFYIIVRLWVDVYGVGPGVGVLILGVLGAGAIIWGSLLALRQRSLKRLIAYSTAAHLGYLFVLFPLLAGAGDGVGGGSGGAGVGGPEGPWSATGWNVDAWTGGLYHALSHAVAKAAMFLAAGSMTYAVARDDLKAISGIAHRLPMSFLAFGLGGLCLAGLPPSGGFVAKWLLLRAALAQGAWGWALLLVVGGLLTLAYVLLVLRFALDRTEAPETFRPVPARMEAAALALALGAVALGVRATEILAFLEATLAAAAGGPP